jgi:hypothetical protein
MSRNVLVIWTARSIPPALHHFEALKADVKVWVRGHTEAEVAAWLAEFVSAPIPETAGWDDSSLVTLVPDDVVVSQAAYDAVLQTAREHPEDAASGWANVDFVSPLATVMVNPVPELCTDWPELLSVPEVAASTVPIRASWSGMTLHTMPVWMWREHPIEPHYSPPGSASDHALARSLQAAGRSIWVEPRAAVMHLKVDHTRTDTGDAWKQLNLADKRVDVEVAR